MPTYTVVEVSPRMATEWLEKNTAANRPVSDRFVDQYARDMANDEWQFNGQPIIFDEDGTGLLDGQHRLWAVIKSGKTVRVGVLEGIDRETFLTMDGGHKRTTSDVLAIAGETNTAHLGAEINYFGHLLTYNDILGRGRDMSRARVTQLLSMVTSEKLHESIAATRPAARATRLPNSFLAAMHRYLSVFHAAKADIFFEKLGSGEGLYAGDPVYALRTSLFNRRLGNGRNDLRAAAYLIISAWNAYRRGTPLSKVVYVPHRSIPKPV